MLSLLHISIVIHKYAKEKEVAFGIFKFSIFYMTFHCLNFKA